MIPQKIQETAILLLQLQGIENKQAEIALMQSRIITVEKLNNENQYLIDNEFNAQYLTTIDACKDNLQSRLIKLEIIHDNNKITACSLYSKLKDTITAYYTQQGLSIKETDEIITNCEENIDLFTVLLESKLASKFAYQELQSANDKLHINLHGLKDYLDLHVSDTNNKKLIFEKIKMLAIDNDITTILLIVNFLDYEFYLPQTLQEDIIRTLYNDETVAMLYRYKNNCKLLQQHDDKILRNKYELLKKDLQQETERKARIQEQEKYQKKMDLYRANGLELAKKDTLAIGSKICDSTGSLFNPETTIFADLEYADLIGDILETIDDLHSVDKNYNKFKYIAFTCVPGYLFKGIDESLALLMKIHDILKPGGIVMICCGTNPSCKKISNNQAFIDYILIPAGFLLNEIVSFDNEICTYKTCLFFFKRYKNKSITSINDRIQLIVRKSSVE